MILQETIHLLKTRYSGLIHDLTITDARIGLHTTALLLSDGSMGLSSTYSSAGEDIHCKKQDRDFGDFTPARITGQRLIHLLELDPGKPLMRSLKVAALNAVSSGIIATGKYKVMQNTDPIDLLDFTTALKVVMVGAFHSYIATIAATPSHLQVLELNPEALKGDDRKYYVPAGEYKSVLPGADVVIITGLTLVNNTFDDLLEHIDPKSRVVVTGPSSSFVPDVLFQKKVNLIGAVRITDKEMALKVVSEGGAGYHLFEYCAEKICILNE